MENRKSQCEKAIAHLNSSDPIMRRVIRSAGPFTLRLESNRFGMLVRSVLSQQLSTLAARAIRGRVEQLAGGELTPHALIDLELEQLRLVGVSQQKANCILSLTEAAASNRIVFSQLGRYSNESIIEQLTQIRGIGTWTAQMFLIFALGRMNVFPFDDLGVRTAIRNEYILNELPNRETANRIAEVWQPYASVASWYCWRSIDNARRKTSGTSAEGYPT